MSKDKITEIDESMDFGFTFVDSNELSSKGEVDDLQARLTELRGIFLPLLTNLNKNPDKEMIKWPNRKKVIDEQIKKLIELTTI